MTKFMSDIKIFEKGSEYNGFCVLNVFELKDYHSTAIYLRHKKTGLEVLHLVNDETENLFSFTFRTPNPEGNGAAHIMEHSVLCGSERYPLKDPFTQLSNQSVKTYLNAATYADKTVYPASSTVEADYFNLMSVYADAVFFPRLSPEIFAQEAHRLEIDGDGKTSIQGVVYNEMKGVYSSFESVAMDVPVRNLLKNSIYEEDSGGDPLKIPFLTYEEYRNFHKKWYRPENCFVFLYGNIPTEKQLDFLQKNFLTRLEEKNPDFEWTDDIRNSILKTHLEYVTPKKLETELFVKTTGPSGEENEKKSTVYVTWDLGESKDAEQNMEKIFLTGVLLNHDGSPLQKALVESELGEDTAPGMGLDGLFHTLFTVGLRGVKKNSAEKVKELVFATLNKIVENGIDKDDIDSTLMGLEISHREIERNNGPFAKSLMMAPINAWLYGNKIEDSFRLRSVLEKVRQKIQNKKGYLEELIEKFFLENKNFAVCEIIPSKKYTTERTRQENALVKELVQKTSLEAIKKENAELHAFQSKKDDTSCLPHLRPCDFIIEGKRISDSYSLKIKTLEGKDNSSVDYFESGENTNGVTYVDVGFPADVLSSDKYKYLSLFAETVCDCGWGKLDWSEAAAETALYTGGITCSVLTSETPFTKNNADFRKKHNFTARDWVVFKLKVIDEKLKEGLGLFADNINNVDFSDYKRLKDIAVETRNDFDSSVVPAGHQYAMLRSLRKPSRVSAVDEILNGLTQIFCLHELAEADPKNNSAVFNEILRQIKAGGGFIHVTAELETIEKNKELIAGFVKSIGLCALKSPKENSLEEFVKLTELDGKKSLENSGDAGDEKIVIPSLVGFAGEAFKTIAYGQKGNAILEICCHWLSNILLWEKVRTIGGAYGAFCDIDSTTGNVLFASYRDPTPQKTADVFENCLKEAALMDFSQDETEKAVMGTYSHFVVPKTPRARGNIELLRTLYAIDDDDRENKLLELLHCTPEELKKGFNELLEFSKKIKYRVIIGPENDDLSGEKIFLPL